jgi:hypothetical protein
VPLTIGDFYRNFRLNNKENKTVYELFDDRFELFLCSGAITPALKSPCVYLTTRGCKVHGTIIKPIGCAINPEIDILRKEKGETINSSDMQRVFPCLKNSLDKVVLDKKTKSKFENYYFYWSELIMTDEAFPPLKPKIKYDAPARFIFSKKLLDEIKISIKFDGLEKDLLLTSKAYARFIGDKENFMKFKNLQDVFDRK